ncbi:MAG: hypothetical protein U9Q58_04885, partial [Pseudomonadota bacterium]|nr:hypothetical protein [Pseudomonadota bacterium]
PGWRTFDAFAKPMRWLSKKNGHFGTLTGGLATPSYKKRPTSTVLFEGEGIHIVCQGLEKLLQRHQFIPAVSLHCNRFR